MMEDEVQYDEVENTEVGEVEIPAEIAAMLDAAVQSDFVTANDHFNSAINDRIADALEQEKVRIANTVFNGVDEEGEEIEDLTDEELDAALEELEDDDLEDEDVDLEDLLDDEDQ